MIKINFFFNIKVKGKCVLCSPIVGEREKKLINMLF